MTRWSSLSSAWRRLPLLARAGSLTAFLILLLALAGPWIAPETPTSPIDRPYLGPTRELQLGTDGLGRDVRSRLLHGGLTVVTLAIASTATAVLLGVTIGMLAAWHGGWVDSAMMRIVDAILAIPSMLLISLLAIGIGRGWSAILMATTLLLTPDLTRIIRAATLQIKREDYVEAAIIRGERTRAILYHELTPNLLPLIAADAGLRLLGATGLVASATFLGYGLQPPAADWSLMVQENRAGFLLQPWAVVAPTILIAVFCLSVCWVGDGIARTSGGRTHGVEN